MAKQFTISKINNALPSTLKPNTLYLLKTSSGLEAHVSDNTGTHSYPLTSSGSGSGTTPSVISVAGRTGAVVLTKQDVSLGNVDNTSDVDKPLSTATTNALNLKANIASPTFTGSPKAPTPASTDDSTSIATTAFVKAALASGSSGSSSTVKGLKKTSVDLKTTSNIDLSAGDYFIKTITAGTTFTISNLPADTIVSEFVLELTNGGLVRIKWWEGLEWPEGKVPALTRAGRDVLWFYTHNAGVTWTGVLVGKDVKIPLPGEEDPIIPYIIDPYFPNVSLIINADGLLENSISIEDLSFYRHKVLVYGSTKVVTDITKYGSRAVLFSSASDYLSVPNCYSGSTEFAIGNKDFTFETWVNLINHGTFGTYLLSDTTGPFFGFYSGKFCMGITGSNPTAVGTTRVDLSSWVHVAASRINGVTRLFVNGLMEYEGNDITSYLTSNTIDIFKASNSNWIGSGYIDEMRLTIGTGRYVSDFTVPSRMGLNQTPPATYTWVSKSMPSENYTGITYGNGKYVAVALGDTKCAVSTDANTWTQSTISASTSSWYDVAYGNNIYVAVASASGAAVRSTDAVTWTPAASIVTSTGWKRVAFGNGIFVATPVNSDKCAISTDGSIWIQGILPVSGAWYGLTFGNGKFVAKASSKIDGAYSTDGLTWDSMTIGSAAQSWIHLTYGAGKYIAIVNNSDAYAYSTNGISWTQARLSLSRSWSCIGYGSGLFVLNAEGGSNCLSSTDCINWSTINNHSTRAIVYGNGKFVTVDLQAVTQVVKYMLA